MSNICAAIGRGQMEVLPERIEQRRRNFSFYQNEIGSIPGISFVNEPGGFFCNRWLTTILVNPAESAGVTREDIRLGLQKENIESRPLWKPMHLQPVFKDYPFYGNGTSDKLFRDGLCLPSGSNLSEEGLERVVECMKEVVSY
jgi:dTDP-4-amino-4,6-dideoxygalactose transaminase